MTEPGDATQPEDAADVEVYTIDLSHTEEGDEDYSTLAVEQLDALEVGPDLELYDAVCDAVELIFTAPEVAKSHSQTITTREGLRRMLPVVGYPHRVFWSSEGPRIEAVFPYS